MKPYPVNDIADCILLKLNADENCYVVNLKLQKLVYYVHAWYLGINKQPFISSGFEAWIHGPANRDLYNRFRDTKTLYSFIGIEDVSNKEALDLLEPGDSEFIDMILDNYAGYNPAELERMTHEEEPWIAARKGFGPMERCTNLISDKLMESYYGKRWEAING